MSFEIPQVFISSTSEFAQERRELAAKLRALGDFRCEPFIYEEEALPGTSPEKHCETKLRESEIVVLILGAKYGTSFPGRPVSIVEWEYETAKEIGGAMLQPYLKKTDPNAVDPRQSEFIRRVTDFRDGTWSRFFTAADELTTGVVSDVKRWRLDSWRRLKDRASERRRWQDKFVMRWVAIVAMLTTAGVGAGALMGIPAMTLLVVLITGVLMLGALGWLLKAEVT